MLQDTPDFINILLLRVNLFTFERNSTRISLYIDNIQLFMVPKSYRDLYTIKSDFIVFNSILWTLRWWSKSMLIYQFNISIEYMGKFYCCSIFFKAKKQIFQYNSKNILTDNILRTIKNSKTFGQHLPKNIYF